ncbi:hypothetical protein Acr_29g0010470 [Actinidia rufa]|uniref:Srp40 C-terminal domain-containing protein n=1 Tax=Actinidia rufa TaxID=165716 RepID=A0A7J0HFY3_9ERIC|nr:hypothetical protein Acr_29g0010470 [Actinidia rufa]
MFSAENAKADGVNGRGRVVLMHHWARPALLFIWNWVCIVPLVAAAAGPIHGYLLPTLSLLQTSTFQHTRADTKFDCYKDQEVITNGISMKCGDSHHSALGKTIEKKKKKKNDEGDDNAAANQSKTADRIADFAMNSREILANNLPTDSNEVIKEKKKSKKVSDSVHYTEQVSELELKEPTSDTVCESQIDESTKKQKKKKKQKSKSISEPFDGNVEQVKSDSLPAGERGKDSKPSLGDDKIDSDLEVKSQDKKKKSKLSTNSLGDNVEDSMKSELKKESFLTSEDANDKGKKSSKKRKRSTSEKNDGLPSKESKSRKTEPLEETKSCEQLEKVNRNEYSAHKSRRNQHEGSAEPKTVNAFQRVKLDDVEFADERLQDNSYWAKDGSEVGYGAKAQEILGQVRGSNGGLVGMVVECWRRQRVAVVVVVVVLVGGRMVVVEGAMETTVVVVGSNGGGGGILVAWWR